MNRGSEKAIELVRKRLDASMRPRFMNRGSAGVQGFDNRGYACFNEAPIHESGKCVRMVDSQSRLQASMRPRFMNRGSPTSRRKPPGSTSCFNEAPIHESGKWRRRGSGSRGR